MAKNFYKPIKDNERTFPKRAKNEKGGKVTNDEQHDHIDKAKTIGHFIRNNLISAKGGICTANNKNYKILFPQSSIHLRKWQNNSLTKWIQKTVWPEPEKERSVDEACKVCKAQWEVPKIIQENWPEIIAINPQRVKDFKPLQDELDLEIAFPLQERLPVSEPSKKAGEEFKYIMVKVKLPFTFNRPGDPITFLGEAGDSYIVKARNVVLQTHCGIEDPVIYTVTKSSHKTFLAPLARQFQEIYDQFKQLGQLEQLKRASSKPLQRFKYRKGDDFISDTNNDIVDRINNERENGRLLDPVIQDWASNSTRSIFNDVHIHTSNESDALSRDLNAKAFTTGQDIFFREGAYRPDTLEGQQLIAHELTHVVQQASGAVRNTNGKMTVNPAGDRFEQEADAVAKTVTSQAATPDVQRQTPEEEDEELQTKSLQREAVPEEEEDETLQRQELDEDEEELNV